MVMQELLAFNYWNIIFNIRWTNNQIVVGTSLTLSQTGDADFVGVVTSFGGFSGSLTGNVTGDLTGNIVSGIMTGNVVGLASTFR